MPNLSDAVPNISRFAEALRSSGAAKQSRYYVELSIPNVVISNYGAPDIDMVNMFVEQTMFPEFVIATQQTRSHSNPVEMPYDRIFGPVTMTFLCDNRMTVKHFFDTWIQGIYGTFGGVLNYYDDYVVPEINIYKIDEQNSKVYCVSLYNAFPKVVNDIMLASNSSDLTRFQVVFSYEMWKSFVIEGDGYSVAIDSFSEDVRQSRATYRGEYIGSMPSVPSIDFIDRNNRNTRSASDIVGVGGVSTGLEILNKMRNPRLMKDAMKRAARSVGHEILRGPKAAVLNSLPRTIRQIGGSVLGRIGI